MIVRALMRLVSLAALAAAGWWIARLLRGAGRREQPGPAARPENEGAMVRDRVCNTFLPRASAIEARIAGSTHFFCSEACRRRYLTDSGVAESA